VRCWGYNGEGELGYGHYDFIGDTETPASVDPVALGGDAVAISAGGYHSCALLESGVVRCWGYNADGQLGYGNTMDIGGTEHPASVGPVALGAGAVAVSAGEHHSCALLATTRVRCWGLGEHGRLGYGGVADLGDVQTPDQVQPLTLSGPASAITAGGGHTCAVQTNGPVDQVACWGRGSFGQLGYGNPSDIADEPEEGPDFGGGVALGGSVVTVAPVCANLADDNGDMLTDFPADPDCASPWGSSEGAQVVPPPPPPPPPPAAACDDGIDNDADGAADFPADPGCGSSGDTDETDPQVPVNARPDSDIAPLKSRIRAAKLKRLRGSASDADGQVAKVHIAVERKTGTGSRTRCRALAKTGRLKRHKAVKGACTPRIWIRANGTTTWSYRLKRALPAGRYTLYSRAMDNLKLREAGFSKADGTKRVIRIRP
jgi:hypothetical protein